MVGLRDWGLSPVKLGVGGGDKKKKQKPSCSLGGVGGGAGICTEPRSTSGGNNPPSKIQDNACLRQKLN